MKNFRISESGFTLVELLVTVGLVLIIGTVGTNVIASILRSYNKAHIINEIEQNGSYALSLMESQIRNAKLVSLDSAHILNVTPQEGNAYQFIIEQVTRAVGVNTFDVGVVEKDTEVLTNDDPTTGVDVVIDNGTPADASYFAVDGNKVTIVLEIRQAPNAPGRVDYQAATTLRTTVVVRGGYQ